MSVQLERLVSPSLFDIIFPLVAFGLVIVLPAVFAVFFVVQVARGRYPEDTNLENSNLE